MAFRIPRNQIFEVTELDVRLDPGPHPYLADRSAAIAENWRAQTAANPALFDGEVMLLSALAYQDRRLKGRCHIVRYSEFLFWRGQRPVASAEHAFAYAVLVSSDGALVAIRMAAHTVNAGQVYFAAGSFEPMDFPEGKADVDFNMRREVLEETGLDLEECRAESSLQALSMPTGTVIFRRYFSQRPAEELSQAIAAHVRSGADDEIVGPVVIRGGEPLPERLAPQMPPIIDWHFSTPPVSGG